MKYLFPVLIGVVSVISIALGIRFWLKQSTRADVANLISLKQTADAGASLEQVLLKTAHFDYVLNKLDVVSPSDIELKPDFPLAWDQTSSLTESTISEITRVKEGNIELRRKAGGFF